MVLAGGKKMTNLTHKVGGIVGMAVGYTALKSHGLLATNLSPYVQLLIMFPAASWGSTAPDLDLEENCTAGHSPLNMAVGGLLHIIGAKHRSWQTHCLAIMRR
jgi:hypothetical protein